MEEINHERLEDREDHKQQHSHAEIQVDVAPFNKNGVEQGVVYDEGHKKHAGVTPHVYDLVPQEIELRHVHDTHIHVHHWRGEYNNPQRQIDKVLYAVSLQMVYKSFHASW